MLNETIQYMVGKRQRRMIFRSHNGEPNWRTTISKKRWSVSDLSTLKREFRNGTQLKVIARMLGRTETAVNKILSRKGIRYDFSSVTPALQVSNFIKIIHYLENKHYKITRIDQAFQKCEGRYTEACNYKINNVLTSRTRLIILANKLRIEEGLPIFKLNTSEP